MRKFFFMLMTAWAALSLFVACEKNGEVCPPAGIANDYDKAINSLRNKKLVYARDNDGGDGHAWVIGDGMEIIMAISTRGLSK